ncbi:unnamed protein product [Mytilus coruscus]|uniref:Uncharacterized protein n=1 Tax=Mytilus coruscus TaxID=42192 RepID=A0A6J8EPH7_MYTCO|nr:unnamed protein product [Mytilus coruscus]
MEETFVIFISVCLLAGITGKPARRCCSSDTVPSCLCLQDEDLEVCQFEEQVPIIEVRGYCKCSIIYHEGILSTPPVVVNSERATCSWNCKSGLCSPFENFTTTTTATYPTASDITKDTTTAYLSSTSDPSTSEDPVFKMTEKIAEGDSMAFKKVIPEAWRGKEHLVWTGPYSWFRERTWPINARDVACPVPDCPVITRHLWEPG